MDKIYGAALILAGAHYVAHTFLGWSVLWVTGATVASYIALRKYYDK